MKKQEMLQLLWYEMWFSIEGLEKEFIQKIIEGHDVKVTSEARKHMRQVELIYGAMHNVEKEILEVIKSGGNK